VSCTLITIPSFSSRTRRTTRDLVSGPLSRFCAQPGYVANGRTSEKNAAVWAAFRQHNNQRDCSHLSSDGSSFQITVFGNPSEQETGGSQAANAFSFMRILI